MTSQVTATAWAADLETAARELRIDMLEMHRRAGGGHLGSSLSIVEILVTILARVVRPNADDRLVLSKGHAALGLYCALARSGRIDPSRLADFGRDGAALEAHPNECAEPAVHASTGSLGQGLSIGVGLALGSRMAGREDERTVVIFGDGEANEGQIWEAARCAATLRLRNLIAVLDDNGMQQDGPMAEIMPVDDLAAAWAGMGWICAEADGHDCAALERALSTLLADDCDAPRLLRAKTVKACGVPFLEGLTESHYPPPLSAGDIAFIRYEQQNGSTW